MMFYLTEKLVLNFNSISYIYFVKLRVEAGLKPTTFCLRGDMSKHLGTLIADLYEL